MRIIVLIMLAIFLVACEEPQGLIKAKIDPNRASITANVVEPIEKEPYEIFENWNLTGNNTPTRDQVMIFFNLSNETREVFPDNEQPVNTSNLTFSGEVSNDVWSGDFAE